MATQFPTGLDSFTNPTGADYLNSPDHAGQHADKNDAVEALQAKVGINNSADTDSIDYKLSKLHHETNTLHVGGTEGEYATIAEAITYLGTLVTTDAWIIRIAGGTHEVASTITINLTMPLFIIGAGSEHTIIVPTAALTNSDMFVIQSNVYFNRLGFEGTADWQAGTTASFLKFDTNGTYSEITDFAMTTCKKAFELTAGAEVFGFNFVIEDTTLAAICVDTDLATPAIDFEVGNLVNCAYGVELASGVAADVYLVNLRFLNEIGGTGIMYVPANFGYSNFTIQTCEWNHVGTFQVGMDFTLARDANIELLGVVGYEDKRPHGAFDTRDATSTTTVTTAGTLYKVSGINSKPYVSFDAAGTAGTYTISVGAQTTAAIAFNAADATIKAALEALSNVTTVTVTTAVANKEWTIEFLTTDEGWVSMPVTYDISGLTGPTSYEVQNSYYTCKYGITNNKMTFLSSHRTDAPIWVTGSLQANANNRTVTLGIRKNGVGRMIASSPIRAAVANRPYPFSFVVYVDPVVKDDFFELWLTSSNSGDVITVVDTNLFFGTV